MTETNRSQFKKRAAALAVASCLSLAPWVAEAAGLGKLTVYSGLGQLLRAELEIGASRDELAGMTARLAPVDAFKQAGVDYASALTDLRFVVEKRANGQSIVKVTSVKPVNEPFLDFLVELNWPSGRLVREYTFLLDPPEIAAKGTGGQVSVAEAKVVETVRGGGAGSSQPAVTRSAPRQPAAAKVPAEPKKTEASGSRVVQPGETLRKIASETKYDGVSLEQMLVGLFQSNPDAFIGKNINRLKAGAILGIPDQAAVEAVSDAEAKKVYVTQAGDWNAYRQKLAATSAKAPAREESASQVASGKITAKVEEKAAPADQSKDQVKIAKTEVATKGGAGKAGALNEADQIAKDKALKEAQDRLALLEKNVGELQKLVEMKTQKLAELQQQSATKKDEVKPVEPAKPVEPVKAPELPKLAEPVKEAEPVKPVEATKPVEEVKTAEVKPPEPVKPPPPPPEKKPAPAPLPEPEEPSLIDGLLSDPLPLAGGAGILALLAGYFMFKRRREQSSSLETTAAPGPSSLGPNSVFRMTGGQSVDTGNTPPQTGDFSQTGPGTIDTDEVDPVAEADVYMAYGRDTQAEEILLEALQKDPQRTAIHAKLLEIYANRKSLKQFETLASELYAQTGGAGPEWEKVAALGAGLDPANPLYSGVQAAPVAAFNPDATMIVSSEDLGRATVAMPGTLSQLAEMASLPEEQQLELAADTQVLSAPPELSDAAEPVEAEEPASDAMSLDFDLGLPEILPEAQAAEPPEKGAGEAPAVFEEPYIETMDFAESNALDFDLGAAVPVAEVAEESPVGELHVEADDLAVDAVDFDLGGSAQAEAVEPDEQDAAPDFSPEGTMVMPLEADSEMDSAVSTLVGVNAISDSTDEAETPEPPVEEEPMVDFDLDIDSPATQTMVNSVLENESTATVLNPLPIPSEEFEFDHPELAATSVSPGGLDADSLEFDVSLTDSVFLGQPMVQPDFDIGSINLDLASEPVPAESEMAGLAATTVMPEPLAESFAEALAEPARDSQWEEVNTKLDLAKAYEEMGDLEGARELLQEVVGEGPVDLVEQARAILGRIGE
ncbi:hypothetical protein AT959_12980 [Dechloromonas denitrificans]|uniref:FimV N-terminal domain-containing protein n=1 Tax=Dechloromonas denitrificans TaxID=281362 RepID=A0A133XHB1_9RHOO|nr:FimV/HubP family polar landmark protein [Dechloromonas denitrificans]KXB30266.1 hypothetical protein AT959_12980 [Dechloromonas denitrificans]